MRRLIQQNVCLLVMQERVIPSREIQQKRTSNDEQVYLITRTFNEPCQTFKSKVVDFGNFL